MARIRSVKPGLFGSYSMASVSIPARYLFIGLFSEADDEGRLIDSPKRIAGSVFPHDSAVTERKVDGWLGELHRSGGIFRYEACGGRYICLPKWTDHQRISHPLPSPLPPPDGNVLEDFLRSSGTSHE